MKILVIDRYNYARDLAQMDMYQVLSEEYNVGFAIHKTLMTLVKQDNYDYLYLGIYHPWCGISNLEEILKINKKPVIIDQADNEGFIARISKKNIYSENNILLSRYLPNENLGRFWKDKICLLPWYINPNRFIPQEKTIDVSFVCTINIKRLGVDRKKMSLDIYDYCKKHDLSYKIGEYFKEYRDIVTKSKVMVIDGSRYCLTQKYIEAALSNCIIVGEKPISPPNEFITINLESINSQTIDSYNDNIISNRKYALETFANKSVFLDNFKKIISEF